MLPINYLDFTISSLLIHDPKNKILYTEPIFFLTFISEKYIPKEFFLCPHLYSLFGYTVGFEWVLPSGSWDWLLCPRVVWKELCSFQKQLWGTICTVLSPIQTEEYGLLFKETSLRVRKLGMPLGIYFNFSWSLFSSPVSKRMSLRWKKFKIFPNS